MNFNKKTFFFILSVLLLGFTSFGWADSGAAASDALNSGNYEKRANLLYYLFVFINAVAAFIGVAFFVHSLHSMSRAADSNRQGASPSGIIIMMLVASVLISLNSSIGLIMKEFSASDDGYCNVIKNQGSSKAGSFVSETSYAGDCFNVGESKFIKDLTKKSSESGKAPEVVIENFTLIISLFQSIGLIFFITGWVRIYMISSKGGGNQQYTYGSSALMILFSTFIIDLPNTITSVIGFLKDYGFFSFEG